MKGSIHKKCQHFKEDDCTLSVHLFLFLQFISFGIQLIPTQVLRKEKAFKHLFRLMTESNNQSCGHLFRLKATLHMFKISVSTAAGGIKLSYRSEKLGYSINVVSSYLLNSTIGVPRWFILGPILFLIYINDLPFCSTLLAMTPPFWPQGTTSKN